MGTDEQNTAHSRVGLFGGSFDPIHIGHIQAAVQARDMLSLNEVIFLPTSQPPHKNPASLADKHHRVEMVRRAIADMPFFSVSLFDLETKETTYTIHTVEHFQTELGDNTQLFWIVGWDSFVELPSWRCLPELVDSCSIITVKRIDQRNVDWNEFASLLNPMQLAKLRAGILDTPIIQASSTAIRDYIRINRSIESLVHASVAKYIKQHSLYQ